MGLRNLFVKELRSIFPLYVIFAAVVVLLDFFILYKRASLDNDVVFAITLFLPFFLASAIAIGMGYHQLHVEWKTNSIYLLLSLPIRGWKVLTVKLAAVLSLLIATLLWIVISFALILLRVNWGELFGSGDFPALLPSLLNITFNSFWLYVLMVMLLLVVIQFTFLCGQLVTKFKWLVMVAAFLGMLWLVLRISPLLSNLLIWTPEIFIGGKDGAVYLHSGPFIVLLLMSIGLMGLNGLIFEKEVEV